MRALFVCVAALALVGCSQGRDLSSTTGRVRIKGTRTTGVITGCALFGNGVFVTYEDKAGVLHDVLVRNEQIELVAEED